MSLLDAIDAAGLTGRGGAGFRTAVKLGAAHEHSADLVVNACDGERGAAKDGWIVANRWAELRAGVDLVTQGRVEATYAAHRGSRTAEHLRAAGVRVLEVPDRYVSSEESAILSLLHGGLAKPMTKAQPFVHGGRDSQGRRILPTVVLNAETVWRVAQIDDRGAEWFRSVGTAAEPGPRLVAVGTGGQARVVVETAAGTPLREIIGAAGLFAAAPVLVGGIGGVLLTADEAQNAQWSGPGLAAFGGSTGPGVIELLDPHQDPLEFVGELLAFAAGESAGQCGPCMFGLPALADDWAELVRTRSGPTRDRIRQRLGLLPGRGACKHPDGVARLAASALRAFDPIRDPVRHLDLREDRRVRIS